MNEAYYNEHDPKAAAWLRECIKAGLIAPGFVDERSIVDVNPYELTQYTQHHFFAGIGGWSYALRLAGWPDNKRVVTGSCPCQPFSAAGKQLGTKDERHLWPVFYNIITFLGVPSVFGEQVASKAALEWLDGVFADLEGAGYACGASDLCAASVGADHIRQRFFWMAHCESLQQRRASQRRGNSGQICKAGPIRSASNGRSSGARRLADTDSSGLSEQRRRITIQAERPSTQLRGDAGRLGNADGAGSFSRRQATEANGHGCTSVADGGAGFWSGTIPIRCADGKTRRIKPEIFPLADGVPGRVGLLRGSGNAVVPQVAAEFIKAATPCLTSSP